MSFYEGIHSLFICLYGQFMMLSVNESAEIIFNSVQPLNYPQDIKKLSIYAQHIIGFWQLPSPVP